MKPLHVFLLLFAAFITALADGISLALSIIPYVGIMIALVISYCINITMGAGLILLLAVNGMYHPKWGPAGVVGGLIPGINVLPFWIGMVIAGIIHDKAKEGGIVGTIAGAVEGGTSALSGSPAGTLQAAKSIVPSIRQKTVPEPANDNKAAAPERTPSTLQTKNFDGIKPATGNYKPYVPKAA